MASGAIQELANIADGISRCKVALNIFNQSFGHIKDLVKEDDEAELIATMLNILFVVGGARPGYWHDFQVEVSNMLIFPYIRALAQVFGEFDSGTNAHFAKLFNIIIHPRDVGEIPLTEFECILFARQELVEKHTPMETASFDDKRTSAVWADLLGYPTTLAQSGSACRAKVYFDSHKPKILFAYGFIENKEENIVRQWTNRFLPIANALLDGVRAELAQIFSRKITHIKCTLGPWRRGKV